MDSNASPPLWRQIRSDWISHERDWTRPGFRALAIYRLGAWHAAIESRVLRALLNRVHRTLYRFARNVYGIEIPYTATIGEGIVIEHQGGIVIHGHARIGDDCVIRQGVTLGNRRPDRPLEAPVLGTRVSVGAGAMILGGVHIGDNAVIGANAVVLRDVPADYLAVGVPATIKPLSAREPGKLLPWGLPENRNRSGGKPGS